jgi:ribosomal protein L7/L12
MEIAVIVALVIVAIVLFARGRARSTDVALIPAAPPTAAAPVSDDLAEAVRVLVTQNKKIEAVKLVRERSGLGLKEAKDWVDALETGQPIALAAVPTAAPAPLDTLELESAARVLVSQGKKIQAVKLVRDHTGLGLKEAKDWVERL